MGELASRLELNDQVLRAQLSYIDLIDMIDRYLEFSEMPLETGVAIASALDVSVTYLLQFDLGSPDDVGGGVEEDARTLLAILNEDGQPVTRSVAEEATGWTAERFGQAIRTANHLLTGTGSRLLVDSNDHLVTRSDAPDIDTDAVARFQKLRVKPEAKPKPMDSFEVAKALWPLVHGNAETFRKGDADPQVLRQLADEGVLERFEDGFWFTPKIIKLLNLDLVSTSQMRRRRMT